MAPLSLASCAACCSCSYAVPARPARFTAARRTLQPRGLMPWGRWPALLPPLQAAGDGGPPPESSDGDARVEALEAALRSRKGVKAKQAEAARSASAPRSKTEFAEWKEGGLFPEGWEQMDPLEKIYNLYMGKRGFLFWANKAALASIFTIIAAWVAFRFIGPALGLYQLADDLPSPTF